MVGKELDRVRTALTRKIYLYLYINLHIPFHCCKTPVYIYIYLTDVSCSKPVPCGFANLSRHLRVNVSRFSFVNMRALVIFTLYIFVLASVRVRINHNSQFSLPTFAM